MNCANLLIIALLLTPVRTGSAAPRTAAATTRGAATVLTPRQAALRVSPFLLQARNPQTATPREPSRTQTFRSLIASPTTPSRGSSVPLGTFTNPDYSEGEDIRLASEDSGEKACDKINSLSQFCLITTKLNAVISVTFCEAVNQMKQFCDTLSSTQDVQGAALRRGPVNIANKATAAAKEYATNQLKKLQPRTFIANPVNQRIITNTIARAMESVPAHDTTSVKSLLDLNVHQNVNLPNPKYGSLLSLAIKLNNPFLVKLLLENGAHPNQIDGTGKRPIESALSSPDTNPLIIDSLVDAMWFEYQRKPELRRQHEAISHPNVRTHFTKALNKPSSR